MLESQKLHERLLVLEQKRIELRANKTDQRDALIVVMSDMINICNGLFSEHTETLNEGSKNIKLLLDRNRWLEDELDKLKKYKVVE